MIQISNKQKCTGCTACMSACARHAISMIADEQGFQYPHTDETKCTDCGVCDKVCPFNKPMETPQIAHAYAVKHKDSQILKESTSGGLFTAVSDYVLEQGGVVYGAVLDDSLVVRHIRAIAVEDRDRMRGSKYVQSDLGNVFCQVKKDLSNNKKVLFTGTPCQIAGLKSYLKNKCDGLICMDLICYGVPSPMIYKEHISFLAKRLQTKIIDYKFRPKKWGWHVHREIVCGEKKIYHSTPYTDLWRSLYYSRIVMRPSCNDCAYTNLNRVGDITIGDCRGIDNVDADFGSYDGVTLAIINTQTGKDIFESVSNSLTYKPLNINDVMQPPLRQSGQPNKNSEQFFALYRQYGYPRIIMHFYGIKYLLKYYVKKYFFKKRF